MADRVVKVSLQAQVANYLSGMEQARQKSKELGESTEQLKKRLDAQHQSMTEVGNGLLKMGALGAVGIALAVKKFADFDEAISNVKAATQETTENMGLLRDAALDAGARTVFSATEAANAIEELGKAGLSTADILEGGLDGALDLASAGQLGVAEAAGIAATAIKTFNLRGSDMSHVADLLAAGAGKAMGDVSDLSQAMGQAGLVANSTGLSIEETTGTLAAFASKGLLGSDAGTSFKSMLQRLTPQSNEARAKMEELGISAYDAAGNFIGMEKFAGNLQTSLADLSVEQRQSAMSTIFGSDAVRAATVLYTEGAKGIGKWVDAVDDQGYAAQVAADRLDNLKGDVEALGGALDTALIKSGSNANDVLRFLTETATGAVDKYNELPGPVQAVAFAIGGLGTAVTLAGGAFFVAVPKVAAYQEAISKLGDGTQKAAGLIGKMAKGLGALAVAGTAIAALDAWKNAAEGAGTSSAELSNALLTAKTSQELLSKAFADKSFLGYGANAKKMNEDFGDMIDTVSQAPDMRWMGVLGEGMFALDPVSDQLRNQFEAMGDELANLSPEAASVTMNRLRKDFKLTDEQMFRLIEMSGGYKDALTNQASEAGLATDNETLLRLALEASGGASSVAEAAAKKNVRTLDELAEQAAYTQGAVEGLSDEIRDFGKTTFDVIDAEQEFHESLRAVAERLGEDGYAGGLNLASEAGSKNMDVLTDIAKATNEFAAATYDSTGSVDGLNSILSDGRTQLIETALKFGATREEAERYADQLVSTPEVVATRVELQGAADANTRMLEFVNLWNGKEITMSLFLDSSGGNKAAAASAARLTAQALAWAKANGNGAASGGTVTGVGTSKSDSNLYALSVGEEVIQEPYASKHRALLKQINSGAFQGFANGGTAGYAQPRYAAPTYAVGMGGTTVHRGGDNITINQASDPVGTAQAVQRRQNMLGAV